MSEGSVVFKNEAKNVKKYFAELNYEEDIQGLPTVLGDLVLRNEAGDIIDRYSIKIIPSDEYPNSFPWVYETGGRIPVNIDWHVFPDGHCCIKAFPEEILLCKNGITLYWFIKEQVIPYFFNQKYRELHGFFLHERSHGKRGDLEFFEQHFNTKDINLVLKLLNEAQKVSERKSNSKCLCGSGRKFKKCHRRSLRALRVFSRKGINSFIDSIQPFLEHG